MARDIKLNSGEWIDFVFDGKNKEYGAYKLRQTASKRYLVAFGVMLIFVSMVAIAPALVGYVKAQTMAFGGTDGPTILSNIPVDEDKPDDVIPPPEQKVEPPKEIPIAEIKHTPPIVSDDDQVTAENELKDQDKLLEDPGLRIGKNDNPDGSRDNRAPSLPPTPPVDPDVTGNKPKDNETFVAVEQMPEYPGGRSELMKYLANSIRYPASAAENDIQGKVILQFIVEKDGSITGIKVAKSLDPACDKEAVRVVKSMKPWIPGRQNGRTVRVEFTLPVTYKLDRR